MDEKATRPNREPAEAKDIQGKSGIDRSIPYHSPHGKCDHSPLSLLPWSVA